MFEINGTFRNGHVELDGSVDWPDGERVRVVLESNGTQSLRAGDFAADADWGLEESAYQDTPEFRSKLIGQMDSFAPIELTSEEEAEWQAARQWIKDYTIAAVKKQMGLEP
ncbi:MAG: hypothetical protein WD872_05110 [Pirellulaceae bacterium]